MFCGRPQVVPSVHLRRSLGVPPIVARYSSAICSLFVRYLFGSEPDKYRTTTVRIPDKIDGKSLPAPWVIFGSRYFCRCYRFAVLEKINEMLSKYLLSNHTRAYHLFVVNEADAKGILQFR